MSREADDATLLDGVRVRAWCPNIHPCRNLFQELLKLDLKLSKGCIADILRRNSLQPSPERKGLTWREFLSRHAEVMLCTDLFTKEIWTFCGLKTACVLFVMHLETRRIVLAEATFCPHGRWMSRIARNTLMECDDMGVEPRFIIHDRDGLFIHDFDRTLKAARVDAEVVCAQGGATLLGPHSRGASPDTSDALARCGKSSSVASLRDR